MQTTQQVCSPLEPIIPVGVRGPFYVVFFLPISALYSEMQVVNAIEGINNTVIFVTVG